jgi:hypothetical protein
MDLAAILKALAAATEIATALAPLIAQAKDALTSDQLDEVRAALARLQGANDAATEQVLAALAIASGVP